MMLQISQVMIKIKEEIHWKEAHKVCRKKSLMVSTAYSGSHKYGMKIPLLLYILHCVLYVFLITCVEHRRPRIKKYSEVEKPVGKKKRVRICKVTVEGVRNEVINQKSPEKRTAHLLFSSAEKIGQNGASICWLSVLCLQLGHSSQWWPRLFYSFLDMLLAPTIWK